MFVSKKLTCCFPPKQVFRAVEYMDTAGVMEKSKETLLRLLNHPNLVSLVAVVQDANVGMVAKSYTVWEDCNRGTLNRLLWHESGERQKWVQPFFYLSLFSEVTKQQTEIITRVVRSQRAYVGMLLMASPKHFFGCTAVASIPSYMIQI